VPLQKQNRRDGNGEEAGLKAAATKAKAKRRQRQDAGLKAPALRLSQKREAARMA